MTKRWTTPGALAFLCLVVPILATQAQTPISKPDLVLTGDVTGAQNKTYFEIPFNVPAGTHRLSVDFHYTGAETRHARPGRRGPGTISRAKRGQQKPLHDQRDRCHPVLSARRDSHGPVEAADFRAEYAGADGVSLSGRDSIQRQG